MKKKNKTLGLITLLVYVFLIGPLLVIAAASFSDTNYLTFPGQGFTLRWYAQVLTVSSFIKAAQLSLFIALAGTAIALLLGLPAAYALNRFRFKGKELIKTIFLSPVLIPCIVLGFIMLRYVVNQYNMEVIPSLLIGHTLLSIPYIMRVVTSSLANFDFAVEEAACNLGATRPYTFFHIVLPQVIKNILPPTSNEVITLVKDTALVQILGVADLMRAANSSANATFSVVPLAIAGVVYFVLNFLVERIFHVAEKRLSYYR